MYCCDFPGCDYETELRSQIVDHHIIPRSMGGDNKQSNRLMVCPTHHAHIFIEGMKHGIHSKKNDSSIIIETRLFSTGGHVIQYKTIDSDDIKFHCIKT